MMLWMNVAGGVNCRPGSVERKRGRLLRSEIAPNWPARNFCAPALFRATISPSDTLDVVADGIFRVPGEAAMPLPAALLVVVVLIGGSIWILARRVRGVEVVA